MIKHGTCLCLDWWEASYVISFADSGNLSFFAFAPFGKQSLECKERRNFSRRTNTVSVHISKRMFEFFCDEIINRK
jgi:hypothetical protein